MTPISTWKAGRVEKSKYAIAEAGNRIVLWIDDIEEAKALLKEQRERNPHITYVMFKKLKG